jgi:hypothetical protein
VKLPRSHTRGMGTLYCGDNLGILKRYFKDETVDLFYLHPLFNSNPFVKMQREMKLEKHEGMDYKSGCDKIRCNFVFVVSCHRLRPAILD